MRKIILLFSLSHLFSIIAACVSLGGRHSPYINTEFFVIVQMLSGSNSAQLHALLERLDEKKLFGLQTEFDGAVVVVVVDRQTGLHPHDTAMRNELAEMPGVERIVAVSDPFQLASRKFRKEPTVIRAGSLVVGNGEFGIIAGPCTVETEKQTVSTAIAVKKAGATGLRGGAFKPRTSPYVFQGLKEEGLKILAKARKETGLAIVTEAMAPEEVPLVAEYADVVQVGARNVQNYRLLEAVGKIRKPVLLKRGFTSTHEEFLMSAEYILAGGNQQVILCERGIRTFETYTRFTLPLAIIPELKTKTHLPIIVDPSHAMGAAHLVGPMSAAATAAGADGLLIEVHPDPKAALCDGRQSLTFSEFQETVERCKRILAVLD